MQNCGGRAMFNLNYNHTDMRTPTSLLANPLNIVLSVDAPEFVPSQMASNVGPNLNHQAYQQQQQHLIHLHQQQQQFQSPQHQHLNHTHPQQPFHLAQQPQQPQAILHPVIPMQNSHPNQRRGGGGGGGRHSVQDRLNPNADPLHKLQIHHQQQQHHHHQGQNHHIHIQQQHHHQQQQQHHHNIPPHHLQHHNNQGNQSIGKHQMHQVHKLEQQQQQQHSHNNHHHQQHHQQQHSNNMRRNNAASNAPANVVAVEPSEDALPTEAEGSALNFLVEVIGKLNEDPGMFENCQKELNAIYIEFSQNTYVISNAIEIIFDQSICEQNFRYMGAKICRLLDAIDASPNSQFRSLLRMKMAFNQEENQQFMTNEAHKVRGTTLFLAELFLQLQNDGSRIADIAHVILQTIDLLLQKTTPENIKCVCFALKLCGYDLELDCPNEVGCIINSLKQMNEIDVSTERLIKSVLDLAANRWGRNETTTLATPVIEHTQQVFTNDPVFYGPDGKIITEEESSFLSSILAAANETCDDSEKDELDSDPEMDDEMQVAYKDFLQEMKK